MRSIFFFLIMLSTQLYATGTGHIFVTNEKDNTISIIDSKTLEVINTVEVGKRPRGIGLSPDKKELYVAASEDNKIVVLDPKSLEIIRSFNSGSDPETFAVHPDGNLYISNEDDAKASIFNPKDGSMVLEIKVGLEPEGVVISADGKHIIVTSESSNMLHVIEYPSNQIKHNIVVGPRPRSATFNKAGVIAYSTSEISGEVMKIDIVEGKVLDRMSLGDDKVKPKDILLSLDEKQLFVAGGRSNNIAVINANTMALIKRIPVGKRVWGLALSKDGKRLFTTDGVSGTVSVIDTKKLENIKTIKVGKFPWGIVIDD